MFSTQEDLDHYIEKLYDEKDEPGKILTRGDHIIFRDNGTNTYKHMQVTLPSGDKIRPRVHIPVLLKKLGKLFMDKGMESSHLCHIKNCINPSHLCSEPKAINLNRIHCVNWRSQIQDPNYCIGHFPYPRCMPVE